MTLREENIVNIAMIAGEMLKAGRIERDELTGHAGLTAAIVQMAEDFEKKFAGVDWNDSALDYWEEIDRFAEEQLLGKYACVQVEQEPLQIKVVIEGGLIDEVLKDQNVPVMVEVVDLDREYADHMRLSDYRDKLYKDKSLMKCDYGVADFTDDAPPVVTGQGEREEAPVKVFVVSPDGDRREVFSGDLDECDEFFSNHEGRFQVESGALWELDIVDSREKLLPEGYYEALDYYNNQVGEDIESELVRRYAEELVDCYQHERDITDFISWTMYEALLDEKISYEECVALDRACEDVPSRTDIEQTGLQEALRVVLARVRESELLGKVQAEQEPALGPVLSFPVTVYGESAGGARIDIFHGDFDACLEFCKARNWEFKDGNGFVWDLEMEDVREDSFPEEYYDAREHYADLMGCDIENEYMRQHVEELTTCFQKGLDFSDYAHWCGYETLLGEKITFAEFRDLDEYFLLDPNEIDKEDRDAIRRIKFVLGVARDKNEKLAAEGWLLDAKIQEAEGLRGAQDGCVRGKDLKREERE